MQETHLKQSFLKQLNEITECGFRSIRTHYLAKNRTVDKRQNIAI